MTKLEFLDALCENLSGLPQQDIDERLEFYSEMIDDRIEEGLTEDEAIADIGSPEKIAEQIIKETPLVKIVKKKLNQKKRKLTAWEIVFIAAGFPIWIPVLATIFAVAISCFAAIWSVAVSLWAVFAAFVGGGVGGILSGTAVAITSNVPFGLFLIFAGILLCGLSIFLFFGCIATTKSTVWLTKKIALCIKRLFLRKEAA